MSAQMKKRLALVAVALAVVAVMVTCWFAFGPKSGGTDAKNLSVTVVYADESDELFTFETSAEFLRGALEEQSLIEGEESEYGLFVKTVNGVTADDSQEQWWCFTKGGEELMTGVDSTPIADGEAYEIELKTGY